MAYDEAAAFRLRAALAGQEHAHKRRMFGGLAFVSGLPPE